MDNLPVVDILQSAADLAKYPPRIGDAEIVSADKTAERCSVYVFQQETVSEAGQTGHADGSADVRVVQFVAEVKFFL